MCLCLLQASCAQLQNPHDIDLTKRFHELENARDLDGLKSERDCIASPGNCKHLRDVCNVSSVIVWESTEYAAGTRLQLCCAILVRMPLERHITSHPSVALMIFVRILPHARWTWLGSPRLRGQVSGLVARVCC